LVGVLTVEAAGGVSRARRDTVPVFEIMTPLAELARLSADTPVNQAAEMLRMLGNQPALVDVDGQIPAPIRLSHVLKWIDRLEVLGG